MSHNFTIMTVSAISLSFDINKLIELCRQHDVETSSLFGSMTCCEANDQSDIDLLVAFSNRRSLLSLVSLERKISVAFGRKVDLLTEAAISPYLHDRIMKDAQVLYQT
jgi:uncharacterized protein